MSAGSARGPQRYCINDNEEGDNEDNDLGAPVEKSEGGLRALAQRDARVKAATIGSKSCGRRFQRG